MAEAQGLYQKALKTVQKHQMIQRGDTVAAGVSGGADSVAMLDFFYHLRERMPLQITVCHLNHQLRGAASARGEAFVRELAERYHSQLELYRAIREEYLAVPIREKIIYSFALSDEIRVE